MTGSAFAKLSTIDSISNEIDVTPRARHPPAFLDHRDMRIRSVIDVHLRDRAKWVGAAYGDAGPNALPWFGLMFRDGEAGTRIFERWRERFGDVDGDEEIYIGRRPAASFMMRASASSLRPIDQRARCPHGGTQMDRARTLPESGMSVRSH